MAVYTKINKQDISEINKKFEIEKIINFQGIKQGIENTNYLLKSKKKKIYSDNFRKKSFSKRDTFFFEINGSIK